MTDDHERDWAGKKPATEQLGRSLRALAREMRNNPTHAERNLWSALRNGQRLGFKFRRQHVVDRFIVDFYCSSAHLIIEVDGEVHQFSVKADEERQAVLESLGLTVIRFTNDDVLKNRDGVVALVDQYLAECVCQRQQESH